MSRQSFVVLTEDEQFAAVLRSVLRGAVVMVASCLDQIPDRFSEYRLIVDPLSVRECCLESIRRMRRGRPVGSVSTRDFLAAPSRSQHDRSKTAELPIDRAHAAWIERDTILSSTSSAGHVDPLIALARAHDHEAYSVDQAAWELAISSRQLNRIAMKTIGYPPGVILGLARIVSVANSIQSTRAPLGAVASAHAYCNLSSLYQQFIRYVGLPPSGYREQAARALRPKSITPVRKAQLITALDESTWTGHTNPIHFPEEEET